MFPDERRPKKFQPKENSPQTDFDFPDVSDSSSPYELVITEVDGEEHEFEFDQVSSFGQNDRNFVLKLSGETTVVLDTQGYWIGRHTKQKLRGLSQTLG